MPFDYAKFRSAFRAAKRAHHTRMLLEDQRKAAVEAIVRPTEFAASLHVEASRRRLTLTPLEKRVLHYDKLYLLRAQMARSDYMTPARAYFVAQTAGCRVNAVPRLLNRIEWIFWWASLLDIEVDADCVTCVRRHLRRAKGKRRRKKAR